MQIPLNVLLYRLASNSIYETLNIDLSESFSCLRLFDMNAMLSVSDEINKELYLVTHEELSQNTNTICAYNFNKNSVFLCICNDEDIHIDRFSDSLSIVLLYTKHSYAEIFNKILTIFHDFEIWDKNFHLTLLRGGSMQDLLDLSCNILTHPMVVLDSNFSLLGEFRSGEINDVIMNEILNAGYVTPQVMSRLRQDGLISTSETAANPLINYYCVTTHDCYYSMMYRFTVNNNIAGYALIFRNRVHPKTNYLYLMNMVAENLELFFQQERYTSRSFMENYEVFLIELLENQTRPQKQLEDQVSYIPGLAMEGYFTLAQLTYHNISELPLSFLNWNLRNSFSSVRPFIYKNQIFMLKTNADNDLVHRFFTPEEEALFRNLLKNHAFTCTVSNPFFSLMDLPAAVIQCKETLKLSPSTSNVFYYFENVTFRYILHNLKKDSIKLIESPHYHLLKQYDLKHNTDLCEIYIEYLKNGRNINQTAGAIFMHRNTVFNKIKKAISIMHNECEDYQSQITFILSYLNDLE